MQRSLDQQHSLEEKGRVTGGASPVTCCCMNFPVASAGKESACNAGDLGLIPGWGRSPGEGNGNPFQCSYLEDSMDRGAWQATVPGGPSANARDVRDMGLILGSGISPGGRHDNPLQYSYLENPMDRETHLGYMIQYMVPIKTGLGCLAKESRLLFTG